MPSEKRKEQTRAANRKWEKKNPEKVKANQKKWKKENKGYHNEYNKKYNGSPQVKARNMANNKIKIPKGMLCQNCHLVPAVEKHHPDYSKPLDILFVCKKCHTKLHTQLKAKAGGKI